MKVEKEIGSDNLRTSDSCYYLSTKPAKILLSDQNDRQPMFGYYFFVHWCKMQLKSSRINAVENEMRRQLNKD